MQWLTNESFPMMSLRWAGRESDVVFALMTKQKATDEGSRLYVSNDYGMTFRNRTEELSCARRPDGPNLQTTLHLIYATAADKNFVSALCKQNLFHKSWGDK